jgi:hypothetical protein
MMTLEATPPAQIWANDLDALEAALVRDVVFFVWWRCSWALALCVAISLSKC